MFICPKAKKGKSENLLVSKGKGKISNMLILISLTLLDKRSMVNLGVFYPSPEYKEFVFFWHVVKYMPNPLHKYM